MNIKEYLDILKDLWTPTNASKIRMAINNALEMMGNNLKENIDRQDNVETQFQDVIDNTTGKDVISAPEIIAARNGEANLKTRLDKEKNETAAQLAQSEKKVRTNLSVRSGRVRPLVSFVDDDIRPEVWTRWKPVFESKGVPLSIAAITGRLDPSYTGFPPALTWEQLKHLHHELGWEVMGHTYTHPTGNHGLIEYAGDYEKLEFEIGAGCKDILENEGIQVDGFVYPQGGSNENIREITKNHYTYAMAVTGINDDSVMDSFLIKRIAFGSYTNNNPTINGNSEQDTLAYYKACVDYAIEHNAWLVFMLHVAATDKSQDAVLAELIDYIKSRNVEIVNASEGYEVHGNRVFAGDTRSGDYFIIDKYNKPKTSGMNSKITDFLNEDGTKPIAEYETGTITYLRCNNTYARDNGFPEALAGILVTYKFIDDISYNHQEYWLYGSSKKYVRRINADGSYGVWRLIGVFTHEKEIEFTDIPAGGFQDVTLDIPQVSAAFSYVSGNPSWGFGPFPLMYNIYSPENGKVTVRVFNFGTEPASVSSRRWIFSYIPDIREN